MLKIAYLCASRPVNLFFQTHLSFIIAHIRPNDVLISIILC